MKHSREAYKNSGVNVEEGYKAVEMMKQFVKKTHNDKVIGGLGNFSGMMRLGQYKDPVLCSGTDGVGTKLKMAFLMDRHDTVGIDLVAMCVNDILCQGAEPLFFLDYIATGKLEAEKAANLVKGVAEGCLQAGAALLGGETAEMPGFYGDGEYDMAGFAVGVVERELIVDGSRIEAGDAVIGLPSSGFHSNGYSLVRRVLVEGEGKPSLETVIPELGESLGDALIRPTRIYAQEVKTLQQAGFDLLGMCHITGGGFYENVPRMLPKGCGVTFEKGSWPMPKVFPYLQGVSGLSDEELFGTFNMGLGFMFVVKKEHEAKAIETLKQAGHEAYSVGVINDKGEILV